MPLQRAPSAPTGTAVRRRGRERHPLGLVEAGLARLGEPALETGVRVGVEALEPASTGREYQRGAPVRSVVATTRTIELRTEIPGPRSRELLARARGARGRGAAAGVPARLRRRGPERDDHGRRRQHLHRLRRRRRRRQRRPRHPRVVEAIQEQAARFVHTDFTVVPVRDVRRARRAARRARPDRRRRRAPRSSTPGAEAVENAVKIARLAHRPSRGDRVRGRLPRPDAARADDDVEGAPVQDRDGAVRARGLPGAVPERLPRPVADRGARAARADVRDARRAVAGRGDRLRAAARRGRLRPRAAGVRRGAPRGSATARGSSSSPTRCRPASGAPAGCSRWSTSPSRPT